MVYCIIDKSTGNIFTASEKDDTPILDGQAKIIIEGTLGIFEDNPTFCKIVDGAVQVDVNKKNAAEQALAVISDEKKIKQNRDAFIDALMTGDTATQEEIKGQQEVLLATKVKVNG